MRVDGQLSFNSSIAQIGAVLEGCGIAYVPEDLVDEHLATGRLQAVLDDWSQPFPGYHLYHPSRRLTSPVMTVTVDALRYRNKLREQCTEIVGRSVLNWRGCRTSVLSCPGTIGALAGEAHVYASRAKVRLFDR